MAFTGEPENCFKRNNRRAAEMHFCYYRLALRGEFITEINLKNHSKDSIQLPLYSS